MKRIAVAPVELKEAYESWGITPAILSDDFVFVGGQVGMKADGSVPNEPSEQIEQAFINMRNVLEAAGTSFDHIVDLTAFYTNYSEHGSLVRPIREKFFSHDTPTNWTAIGVVSLADPFIFEIKAIAKIPAS